MHFVGSVLAEHVVQVASHELGTQDVDEARVYVAKQFVHNNKLVHSEH